MEKHGLQPFEFDLLSVLLFLLYSDFSVISVNITFINWILHFMLAWHLGSLNIDKVFQLVLRNVEERMKIPVTCIFSHGKLLNVNRLKYAKWSRTASSNLVTFSYTHTYECLCNCKHLIQPTCVSGLINWFQRWVWNLSKYYIVHTYVYTAGVYMYICILYTVNCFILYIFSCQPKLLDLLAELIESDRFCRQYILCVCVSYTCIFMSLYLCMYKYIHILQWNI